MNEGINIVVEGLGSFNFNPGQVWDFIVSNQKHLWVVYSIVAFIYASIVQNILFRRFKNAFRDTGRQIDALYSIQHFVIQFLFGIPLFLLRIVVLVLGAIMYPVFAMIVGRKYSLRGWLFLTFSEESLKNNRRKWVLEGLAVRSVPESQSRIGFTKTTHGWSAS
jgi:hypothetical protein